MKPLRHPLLWAFLAFIVAPITVIGAAIRMIWRRVKAPTH